MISQSRRETATGTEGGNMKTLGVALIVVLVGCGGGGDSGSSSGSKCGVTSKGISAVCNACLGRSCCKEFTACAPGTECNACATDTGVCTNQGKADVITFASCMISKCPDECPMSSDSGAGGTTAGSATSGTGGTGGAGGMTASGTGGSGGAACVPGEQVTCACGSGVEGFQACLKDGTGYDLCYCPEATCGTADNGVCDEPALCDAHTDGADCCYWANDGVCDEPTVCPAGTDGTDCPAAACDDSCARANDGVCQYEARATCDPNTDLTDCAGSCDDSCGMVDGTCDEPTLCALGTDCTDCAGDSCLTTAKDGVCDEASCDPGTDCTDCGE